MFQIPLKINLDSSATIDSFVIGSNIELLEELNSFINNLSNNQSKMLFIWGVNSSGKSHLAQAVCHMFDQTDSRSCVYLPLNNLNISYEILEGLAEVDLVCIDSLETILGKLDWQVALFNLFNELKDAGKSLVVFSNQSPIQMPLELQDLSSRLSSMSVYKLQKINDEKLVEFVQMTSINLGMEINQEVAIFILNRSDRCINHLKEIINTLDEQSLAHQRKVTIPFVKKILKI